MRHVWKLVGVIHGYGFMGNHYHLLLETPEANLVDGMKWLKGTCELMLGGGDENIYPLESSKS